MVKYEKFLAYYSLIIATLLLVVSLLIFPRPQSFLAFGLFLPIVLYFWFRFTLANENNPYRWSVKMVLILLIVGVLGIGVFNLLQKESLPSPSPVYFSSPQPSPSLNEEILGEKTEEKISSETLLEEIKSELSQIKAEQRALRELLEISGSAQNVVEILNKILEASNSALP